VQSGAIKEAFSQIIRTLGKKAQSFYRCQLRCHFHEGTIDSELFGHEKGSFTGAVDFEKVISRP
jgi:DNA-binding NtrC family response regulator